MSLFETMMGFANQFKRESGLGDEDVSRAARLSPLEDELRASLELDAEQLDAPRRLELLFSGDVQGVGFRWTNQSLAQDRHLSGWVENLPDGTVQMQIQGSPRALAAHLERIHAYYARFGNRIWLESQLDLPVVTGETGFTVRY